MRAPETIGGPPDRIGPTTVVLPDGTERQIDVVAATDDAAGGFERIVFAIGEAKAGKRISHRHLHRLEGARAAIGKRAAEAKLLLFGIEFTPALRSTAVRRQDVELIDLERLYMGS